MRSESLGHSSTHLARLESDILTVYNRVTDRVSSLYVEFSSGDYFYASAPILNPQGVKLLRDLVTMLSDKRLSGQGVSPASIILDLHHGGLERLRSLPYKNSNENFTKQYYIHGQSKMPIIKPPNLLIHSPQPVSTMQGNKLIGVFGLTKDTTRLRIGFETIKYQGRDHTKIEFTYDAQEGILQVSLLVSSVLASRTISDLRLALLKSHKSNSTLGYNNTTLDLANLVQSLRDSVVHYLNGVILVYDVVILNNNTD